MSIANLFTNNLKSYQNIQVNDLESVSININDLESDSIKTDLIEEKTLNANVKIERPIAKLVTDELLFFQFSIPAVLTPNSTINWTLPINIQQGDTLYMGSVNAVGSPTLITTIDINALYIATIHISNSTNAGGAIPDEYLLKYEDVTSGAVIIDSEYFSTPNLGPNRNPGEVAISMTAIYKPSSATSLFRVSLTRFSGQQPSVSFTGDFTVSRLK